LLSAVKSVPSNEAANILTYASGMLLHTSHISLSKAKPPLLHSQRPNTGDRIIQHATTDTSSRHRTFSSTNTLLYKYYGYCLYSIHYTSTFLSHSNEPQTETNTQTNNKDRLTDIRRASRQCSADVIPHNRCQNNNPLRNQTSVINLRHYDSEQETWRAHTAGS